MKLSIKNFTAEQTAVLEDFAKEFSLSFSEDGAFVVCEERDDLQAEYDGNTLKIGCPNGRGFFRALLLSAKDTRNKFSFSEKCLLKDLGLMVDCSRGRVPTVNTVKRLIRILAALGYTSLQLYTEDLFEVEGEPFFGYLRGRYSKEDFKTLDGYAAAFGIELIPCVQTLAHFTASARWKQFAENKVDFGDILLVGAEETYAFLEKMFAALRDCFHSNKINIGMDEAHMVGLGKYLDLHGYENRFDILCRHLERVGKIAEKYGFQPMMWSDMLFRLAFGGAYEANGKSVPEEVRKRVPENVRLIYWDYYSTEKAHYDDMFRAHKEFGRTVVFAGGFWTWVGFTPHNGFSFKATDAAIASAAEHGIDEMFFTVWGDNGAECSLFSVLPAMVRTAERIYGHEDSDWLKQRFQAVSQIDYDGFLSLDLPDLPNGKPNFNNPSKYLLYNDCLMGIFDFTTCEEDERLYVDYAKKLLPYGKNKKWGYLFESAAALCRVLSVKANLGNRTHEAYERGDKTALSHIAEKEYGAFLSDLRRFIKAFRVAWDRESKPQGREVHDIRLSGLYGRIAACRKTLRDYLAGRTERISELEEKRLNVESDGEFNREHMVFNDWAKIVTGGIM